MKKEPPLSYRALERRLEAAEAQVKRLQAELSQTQDRIVEADELRKRLGVANQCKDEYLDELNDVRTDLTARMEHLVDCEKKLRAARKISDEREAEHEKEKVRLRWERNQAKEELDLKEQEVKMMNETLYYFTGVIFVLFLCLVGLGIHTKSISW